MTFETIDYLVIAAYFLIVQIIGFAASRINSSKMSSEKEFILAGRKLTLPLFVATLVATWYGSILGVGEFIYKSGIGGWVCFGLAYYIPAAIYGWLLAKRVRGSLAETIPEQISKFYGKSNGIVASILVLIITIPASYILMLGVLVQLFTGWSLWICISLTAILSVLYLFKGGLRSDVWTNTFQFILMYVGFGILTYYTISTFGSISTMAVRLPASYLEFSGGNSWQIIVVWFIIAFQTLIDPSFHQRSAAAKTPAIAQKGIFISIFFWILFDSMTLICGLYARSYFPNIEPLMSYPLLGQNVLPPFFKGIFLVAMLATVMSTLESLGFISAVTLGKDILSNFRWKKFNLLQKPAFATKIGLIITTIFGTLMAVYLPSVVDLIYLTASITVPSLIFPLLLTYSTKYFLTEKKAFLVMIISGILSIFFVLVHLYPQFFDLVPDIEPMLPGLLISAILTGIFIKKR